jgi:hypothetical protein
MHLAEVIQMALHQPLPPRKQYIEMGWVQEEPSSTLVTAAAAAGLLAAGGMFLMSMMRNGRQLESMKTPQ